MADEVGVDQIGLAGVYITPVDLPVEVDRVDLQALAVSSPQTDADAVSVRGVYMDHPYVPPVDYTDNAGVDQVGISGMYHVDPVSSVDAVSVRGVYMDHPYVPPLPGEHAIAVDQVDIAAMYAIDPTVYVDRVGIRVLPFTAGQDTSVDAVHAMGLTVTTADTKVDAVRIVLITSKQQFFPPKVDNFGGTFRYRFMKR